MLLVVMGATESIRFSLRLKFMKIRRLLDSSLKIDMNKTKIHYVGKVRGRICISVKTNDFFLYGMKQFLL